MNNTAAPRYADNAAPRCADNEAQNRMEIWIVEHRRRAERLATDRLTRATKVLIWATGVPALTTIALVLVARTASDGHGGTKRSRQPYPPKSLVL